MAKQSLHGVMQHLRKVAAARTYRALSDGELLERFVAAHDESAFTALIERHGPMVLGVCRRALPSFHDAEDACQSAFLVLARKASSVRKRASLASWLHGVAWRVAVRLRRDHARRDRRERTVSAPAQKDPAAEVSWREVQVILDEELKHLPERYRAPVILCYLECLTRDEAARQLGLAAGTLHGRLERGRDLLRARLAKRGLSLAGVLSAAALGAGVAHAALAPTFVVSSTKAALLLANGQPLVKSVVSTQVLALTQEVLNTMLLTKWKLAIAAALCTGLFAVLLGGLFTPPSVAQDVAPKVNVADEFQRIPKAKSETDLDFIHRVSMDLRGVDPTPTEVHFFVASKDAHRRQKLIDLFIQERQAKQKTDTKKGATDSRSVGSDTGLPDDPLKAAALRERLEKEVQDYKDRKAKQELQATPPLPTGISGVVERIDPKNSALVQISIGSNAGLKKDHILDVFRLQPTSRYLGKIRIVNVYPQNAVARRIGALADAPMLTAGDNVTSSLITPEKTK